MHILCNSPIKQIPNDSRFIDIIDILIEQSGGKLTKIKNINGNTPLHTLARHFFVVV